MDVSNFNQVSDQYKNIVMKNEQPGSKGKSFWGFAGLFFLIAAGLGYWNFHALRTPLTPEGDLAADMLLVDLLREQGYLLVGHYSRWGFNHPGPFWFYLNYFFEVLLARFDLGRFQIWLFGHLVVTACLMTGSAIAFSYYLLKRFHFGFTVFFAASLIGFFGLEMTLLWMPWRIVLPYLCFLLAILYLSEGKGAAFPFAVFLSGVLIHGYITMPCFTLPLLLGSVWLGNKKTGFLRGDVSSGYLWGSAGLIVLFGLPIALDTLGSHPNNISQMLSAQASFREMPKPGWRECYEFAQSLFRLKEDRMAWFAALSLILLFPLWKTAPQEHRAGIRRVLFLCGFVTVLVFGYYPRTPSPLYTFVAQFYVAVPLLALMALGSLAFQQAEASATSAQGLVLKSLKWIPPLVLAAALLSPLQRPGYAVIGENIRDFSDALVSQTNGGEVALNIPDTQQWQLMTGILLELTRRGIPACTMRMDLERIVTVRRVCSPERSTYFDLIQEASCDASCLIRVAGFAIRPSSLTMTDLKRPLSDLQSGAEFINWTRSPDMSWWSDSSAARIVIQIPAASVLSGQMEMDLKTLWPQRLRILWNGHAVFETNKQIILDSPRTVEIAREWIHPGRNVIAFELPDARRPGNGDVRTLAIKLHQIWLR